MGKKILLIFMPLFFFAAAGIFFLEPQETKQIRIGLISLSSVDQRTFSGFKEAMESFGYIEDQTVVYYNDGPAGTMNRLDTIIQKQIGRGVDLFFVSSTPATMAVKYATMNQGIPAVFCPVNDPVVAGIVDSLEYPGGTMTGVRLPSGDRERFSWLIRIAPAVKKILIPYTPGDSSSDFSRMEAFYAARALGVEIIEAPVETEAMLPHVLETYEGYVDALFLPRDSSIESYISAFVQFADTNRLPLSVPSLQQVEQGGLFTYGFIHKEMGRQAAAIAHRILKGDDPASLPVKTAKNYLVINRDTAKKIGLELSDTVRAKADRLISRAENGVKP